MMDQFNEMADKWLNQLEPLADGGNYLDMAEYFGRVTLDVIGKVDIACINRVQCRLINVWCQSVCIN